MEKKYDGKLKAKTIWVSYLCSCVRAKILVRRDIQIFTIRLWQRIMPWELDPGFWVYLIPVAVKTLYEGINSSRDLRLVSGSPSLGDPLNCHNRVVRFFLFFFFLRDHVISKLVYKKNFIPHFNSRNSAANTVEHKLQNINPVSFFSQLPILASVSIFQCRYLPYESVYKLIYNRWFFLISLQKFFFVLQTNLTKQKIYLRYYISLEQQILSFCPIYTISTYNSNTVLYCFGVLSTTNQVLWTRCISIKRTRIQ